MFVSDRVRVARLVVRILGYKKVLANVKCDKGYCSNAKPRQGSLEPVCPSELALVSPRLSIESLLVTARVDVAYS